MIEVTKQQQQHDPIRNFPHDSVVKNLSAKQKTWVQFLGWEDPLEKELATHSSNVAIKSVNPKGNKP